MKIIDRTECGAISDQGRSQQNTGKKSEETPLILVLPPVSGPWIIYVKSEEGC